MRLLRTLPEIGAWLASNGPRAGGGDRVLVPTMGALHAGHAALIRRGAAEAERRRGECVVTIFVNPSQFNDPGDFARYPRTLEADLDLCRAAGADVVVAPDVETVYPPGEAVPTPPVPRVGREPGLEDRHRPGHFAGVCRVVLRLFRLVRPAAAVFGEKDWQQLQVVRALVEQEGAGVEILAHETIREPDGLAMSSRNRFLSDPDRAAARALSAALQAAACDPDPARAERAMLGCLDAPGVRTEYAVVRDAETLVGHPLPGRSGRALVAATVGKVRLIDNRTWPG